VHRPELGLRGGVAQVLDCAVILCVVPHGGEMDPLPPQAELRPGLDETFVDGIELVAIRHCGLQPVPLHDGGLEQGSGSVGVIFEQFGRALAAIGEVHPAVQIFLPGMPAGGDRLPCHARDAQPLEVFLARRNHSVHERERHLLQLLGGRFDLVDLRRGQSVARRLVPIR
jgi:hypothetical protein